MPRIHLGDWVTDAVNYLTKHGKPVFSAISDVVGGLVHASERPAERAAVAGVRGAGRDGRAGGCAGWPPAS